MASPALIKGVTEVDAHMRANTFPASGVAHRQVSHLPAQYARRFQPFAEFSNDSGQISSSKEWRIRVLRIFRPCPDGSAEASGKRGIQGAVDDLSTHSVHRQLAPVNWMIPYAFGSPRDEKMRPASAPPINRCGIGTCGLSSLAEHAHAGGSGRRRSQTLPMRS